MADLQSVLRGARTRLSEAGVSSAALDARILVEHFSGTAREDAILRPSLELAGRIVQTIEQAVERRAGGEPVHRIIGEREFFGLPLKLSAETLEPRPDTETLVEAVLPFCRETAAREGECRILDLGTGTGAIALALLSQVPEAHAWGVDVAPGALETAAANAEALGLSGRFAPTLSDWWEKIEGCFHLIVTNPPYISGTEMEALVDEVRRFDPTRALYGGVDGLDAYRKIATGARRHLEKDGLVALEIGWQQGDAVSALFVAEGFEPAGRFRDFGNNERVLLFR
ncbi:peptide chain release factor N(5)-glutamine methyltransferase [Mesorhizobium sp. RP14(2022)]|uniref:Release factor glutamine methyltransferase n=1 Tax=Mesorhizobium liriopis TaxID=2953882 RepID=A0ABT1CAL8_9HYPH|nr:peptide chain release factor N(5)-glutamine methyltransferase [Mesorhizobium liriopis]MCO6051718.1 peptide chain release factor N(5)-glutamine methyltransferase [Mesorhizobium liriopis]